MICPRCGKEMEHGNASILGSGMPKMIYISDEESIKSFLKRKSVECRVYGEKKETWHCPDCHLLVPLFFVD